MTDPTFSTSTTLATGTMFPPGFDALEPFAPWALPRESQRNARRLASTMGEIQGFYDTMHEHFPHILQALAGRTSDELDESERRLVWLAKSLMEVSGSVELFSSVAVPKAVPAERMVIHQ